MLIEVNNKQLEAKKGETILDTLRRNGLSVPTLCHIKDLLPSGACRMCVVEVENRGGLIPACSYPVEEGMKINTHSARVVEARKTIVELLLADHPDDCLYCIRNKNCELQTLAENLNVRERRISGNKSSYKLDQSSMSIVRDPAKCILCGRCVRVCEEIENVSAIDFTGRGSKTIIGTTYGEGLNVSSCINCGQCILACPTGALCEKSEVEIVQAAIADKSKVVVISYAPSISVIIGEEFGIKPGRDSQGIMTAAMRKIGFDYVFDATFAADLTIMEESSELVQRLTTNGVAPMFTSCCPGWVKYAEQFHVDLLDNLSTAKSPQMMQGAMIKTYWAQLMNLKPEDIYSVTVMPCTAKKFEADREEMISSGIKDIDAVLTTRELASLFRLYHVDMDNIEPEAPDSPLGVRSSAGKLFGATGGVMEAAIRSAHFLVTGEEMKNLKVNDVRGFNGRKETRVKMGDVEIGVAVVSGLKNAEDLIQEIKAGRDDIQFVEVMACPGGCICGGGQPIGGDENAYKARLKALYEIDDTESLRVSHQNPGIKEIYEKFLGKPLSEKSHHLLHTHYRPRNHEVLL